MRYLFLLCGLLTSCVEEPPSHAVPDVAVKYASLVGAKVVQCDVRLLGSARCDLVTEGGYVFGVVCNSQACSKAGD